eukprot:gnl/TRDRNA2_/TRDRNA2_115315_c1_seq1.p1 gnl/TRDRNA2_/TRDRNA2_115315_c1~~gnl/TRDRNA2_/TRDRNA2_115315_c1_seq1.p1  ORF type:complete len:196 (-),score=43.79 gnl/TRDRNA2_/TRDRNA2_115315_c1_seq1:25-570(-)
MAGKVWPEMAGTAIAACLSALKATKLVARVAEAALAAVCRRVAMDASPAAAVLAIVECTGIAVRTRPPQPLAAAVGLRALCSLMPDLLKLRSFEEEEQASAAATAAAALCDEVLTSRILGSAFAEARALLRALQFPPRITTPGLSTSPQTQKRAKLDFRHKAMQPLEYTKSSAAVALRGIS